MHCGGGGECRRFLQSVDKGECSIGSSRPQAEAEITELDSTKLSIDIGL
jgi:hypothetical protein